MSTRDEAQETEGGPTEAEDDAEYQRQLALFVNSSTEKGIELVKIGEIIAQLPHREAFLDIGAGGGDLTIPVSQSFKETVIVEPNRKQAQFLRRRCPHFTVHNEAWEAIDLGAKRFSLVLCSHVLYYIHEGGWLSSIKKMHAHLAPGGRIAIVLQSPLGQLAEFFKRFTDYDVSILELWRDLIKLYGDDAVEVRYFVNEIWTETLEDMVDIGLFLLIDPAFKHRRDEIRDYFRTNHSTENGYRLTQDDILLVVKRRPGDP